MPRKQRFKPSRKQPPPPSQPKDEKPVEVHPDDVDIETDEPARGRADDSAIEGMH